ALGDSADSPRWIETVPKVGYRFLAPVESPFAPAVTVEAEAKKSWAPWIASFCLALVAATLAVLLLSRAVEDTIQPAYRFAINPPQGAVIWSFELSPDGRHLAFIAEKGAEVRLWVRSLEEFRARPIPGTQGADPMGTPFWSPDSRYIGFFAEGKLKKVGITGEPPVALADAPFGRGGSWNEHGQIIFAPVNSGPKSRIFVVSSEGGVPRAVSGEVKYSHRSPDFMPDGEHFLYFSRTRHLAEKRRSV
ncbi:MAG: hypothetical protein GY953_43020, partial [bacterium]|nr:hypothetical protein [bacterium]